MWIHISSFNLVFYASNFQEGQIQKNTLYVYSYLHLYLYLHKYLYFILPLALTGPSGKLRRIRGPSVFRHCHCLHLCQIATQQEDHSTKA